MSVGDELVSSLNGASYKHTAMGQAEDFLTGIVDTDAKMHGLGMYSSLWSRTTEFLISNPWLHFPSRDVTRVQSRRTYPRRSQKYGIKPGPCAAVSFSQEKYYPARSIGNGFLS